VDLTHTMSPDFPTSLASPASMATLSSSSSEIASIFILWHAWSAFRHPPDAPIHFSESGLSADKVAGRAARGVVPLALRHVGYQAEHEADYLLSRRHLANVSQHGPSRLAAASRFIPLWRARDLRSGALRRSPPVNGTMHYPFFFCVGVLMLLN